MAAAALLSLGGMALADPADARKKKQPKAPKGFLGLAPQTTLTDADAERMARAKVGAVRVAIRWPAVQPAPNRFDWTAVDDQIGKLAAKGLRTYVTVSGVPFWAGPDPLALPVGSAQQRSGWQAFLRQVVRRYGQGGSFWTGAYPAQHPGAPPLPVKTLQIWNEQNAPKHVTNPNPERYGELVKISHAAISSQDPGVEIVLGGMFGTPTGAGSFTAWSFLQRLYAVPGIQGAFDSVSLHPYSRDLKGIKKQLKRVRKVLKKRHKKAGLWLTEFGWGSAKRGGLEVGAKKQAKLLKQSVNLLLKNRRKWKVRGALWYTWRDLAPDQSPCVWCVSAGLFGPSGFKPKPAFKQFVRFTRGR